MGVLDFLDFLAGASPAAVGGVSPALSLHREKNEKSEKSGHASILD
jgi:hypothetical protein